MFNNNNTNFKSMNYNKHLIYRRIITLQSFISAWNCLVTFVRISDYATSEDKIYEVTKRTKDKNNKQDYSVTFMLSDQGLPKVLDLDLFDIDIRLLSVQDVKRYIAECNEYGMNCPKYPKYESK